MPDDLLSYYVTTPICTLPPYRESFFGGMERWNGTVEWNGGMDYWNGIVEWPRSRNAARSASWVVMSSQ